MPRRDQQIIEELQKLQKNVLAAHQQLGHVRANMQFTENEKRKSQLIAREMAAVPVNTVTYKAIGRMFLHTPIPLLTQELASTQTRCDRELGEYQSQKAYIERQQAEMERNGQELIAQLKREHSS